MKKILLTIVTTFVAVSSYGQSNDKLLQYISEGCQRAASVSADKAAADAVAVIGASGGNISSQYMSSLNEAKAGYIMLHTAACEAETIRKFRMKTQYPIN